MSHPMDAILGTPKAHRSHLVSTERAHISNRELLEMAAKAHGGIDFDQFRGVFRHQIGMGFLGEEWDPSSDDGDCARMEAALGIDVKWYRDSVVAYRQEIACEGSDYSAYPGDRNAARRMASLKVAAAIGKAMP